MTALPDSKSRFISVSTITLFFTLFGTAFELLDIGTVTIWGPLIGFLLGCVLGGLEVYVFAQRLRGFSFLVGILVKTCTYLFAILVILMGTGLVAGLLQGLTMADFVTEITSRGFWAKVGVIFAMLLGVIFFIERTRLEGENERKELELGKARELEKTYKALEKSHRELKAAQAQLIQSEKMASMGRMTAGIAHEIKNPLNFVNNFAQLSMELTDEIAEALEAGKDKNVAEVQTAIHETLFDLKENVRRIYEHGKRADDIVKSMLEHFRGQPGSRRFVDLNQLLDEYCNLASNSFLAKESRSTVHIKHDYDKSLREIEVEPKEIGRVFLNLLDNAFFAVAYKALMADDSFIPEVTLTTKQHESQIEISISDNGPGISDDILSKIFEPFFTTKPTGLGTGLGLSICYDTITRGYEGDLRVRSTAGEGAVFTIKLPSLTQTWQVLPPETHPTGSAINAVT